MNAIESGRPALEHRPLRLVAAVELHSRKAGCLTATLQSSEVGPGRSYRALRRSLFAEFAESSGWEVGGDASVAVIDTGSTGKIGSQTFDQPVVAFVFGESGLMAGVSLEGSKISRLEE